VHPGTRSQTVGIGHPIPGRDIRPRPPSPPTASFNGSGRYMTGTSNLGAIDLDTATTSSGATYGRWNFATTNSNATTRTETVASSGVTEHADWHPGAAYLATPTP
jgi:hypothetical protein